MEFQLSQFLSHWVLQIIAMALTAFALPRLRITSIFGAAGIVIALALINTTVWDAALFLNVPTSLTSQALVLFASNGLIFFVLVKLLPGIEVDGVLPAIVAPVVFSLISMVLSHQLKDVDWVKVFQDTAGTVEEFRDTIKQDKFGNTPETGAAERGTQ